MCTLPLYSLSSRRQQGKLRGLERLPGQPTFEEEAKATRQREAAEAVGAMGEVGGGEAAGARAVGDDEFFDMMDALEAHSSIW